MTTPPRAHPLHVDHLVQRYARALGNGLGTTFGEIAAITRDGVDAGVVGLQTRLERECFRAGLIEVLGALRIPDCEPARIVDAAFHDARRALAEIARARANA